MSRIKKIQNKLNGFRVRPPNVEMVKRILLHIPYVVVFYVVNKCAWLFQYCRGSTIVDRLIVLLANYPLAFRNICPSFRPDDLIAGVVGRLAYGQLCISKGKMQRSFVRVKSMALHDGEMKKILPLLLIRFLRTIFY